MVLQVKVAAGKLDDLNLIPGTHVIEEENPLPQVASGLHTHTTAQVILPLPPKTN